MKCPPRALGSGEGGSGVMKPLCEGGAGDGALLGS